VGDEDRKRQAEHYRDVAVQVVARAATIADDQVRGHLLDIAIGFVELADRTERARLSERSSLPTHKEQR
jgi:hypothetical protein